MISDSEFNHKINAIGSCIPNPDMRFDLALHPSRLQKFSIFKAAQWCARPVYKSGFPATFVEHLATFRAGRFYRQVKRAA
jgi:hypothetical protein